LRFAQIEQSRFGIENLVDALGPLSVIEEVSRHRSTHVKLDRPTDLENSLSPAAVTSLQLSDDMIVSGSEDGEVRVWSFAPAPTNLNQIAITTPPVTTTATVST